MYVYVLLCVCHIYYMNTLRASVQGIYMIVITISNDSYCTPSGHGGAHMCCVSGDLQEQGHHQSVALQVSTHAVCVSCVHVSREIPDSLCLWE